MELASDGQGEGCDFTGRLGTEQAIILSQKRA